MENPMPNPPLANKKYFVISDVHGFYTPLMEALKEAGYDKDDESHVLILCGDAFDRGDETLKVLNFLRSIPKERRVLVRGNHELLLQDCYKSKVFYDRDVHNGTDRTMCHLCRLDPDFQTKWYRKMPFMDLEEWGKGYDKAWHDYTTKPFRSRNVKKVIDWIFSDDWVNYYDLGKYVFVHSWVPVKSLFDWDDGKNHERLLEDWRNASQEEWNKAMWGCPWEHYLMGSIPEGKTIVCGHWHVMDFHTHLGHDVDGYKNRDIYYSDRLIALDACTAMEPHVCNVLVIDGDKCYDKHGNVLTDQKEAI